MVKLGEFDGMYNPRTGEWNPSRDDFRYSSDNSITGMDMATMGVGLRRWGLGGKVPFWARIGNKGAEVTWGAGKGLYKGIKIGNQWKKTIDSKIANKLKEGNYVPKKSADRIEEGLKKVGRALNSKKGRAGISAAITSGIGLTGTSPENSSSENGWVIRKNKKRRIGFS